MKTSNIRYALESYRLYLDDLSDSTAFKKQIDSDMKELKEALKELDLIESNLK